MVRSRSILFVAFALSGCPKAPPPTVPEVKPAPPAHSAVDHEHASPHGGVVQSTARGHLELSLDRAGQFRVWRLDEQLGALPIAGVGGNVKVAIPGYAEVKLGERGDHLEGTGAAIARDRVAAVVTLSLADAVETARFAVHFSTGNGDPVHPPPGSDDSVIGQITDGSCIARGEAPGPDHAECAVRCIKGGAPIAIVEDKTRQVYVALAPEGKSLNELLLPFVGRRSEVFGKIKRQGGAQFIVVDEVVPEHDHRAREGGAVAMMGDDHLEVTALRSGEIRVYLSDAFRKPVAATGRAGSVDVKLASGMKSAKLAPEPAGKFLRANAGPLPAAPTEVTVRLPVKDDPKYFVTFLLDPIDAPAAAPPPAGTHDVRIDVKGAYVPEVVKVKAGVTTRLHFVRHDASQCAGTVVMPDFDIERELTPLGETIVEVTPKRSGVFPFTCGMGMMQGKIVVKD